MRLEGAALSASESMETCCGFEPHPCAFAARCAPRAARRSERPPGIEPGHRAWRARVLPKTPWPRGAIGGSRARVAGLEDQSLTLRPRSRIKSSWLRVTLPFRAAYQAARALSRTSRGNGVRPLHHLGLVAEGRSRCGVSDFVEPLGNAPSRPACKASQQPSASGPVEFRSAPSSHARVALAAATSHCAQRPTLDTAARQRIERCPSVLESDWPPWPASYA
jgi:hypothetical protein